MVIALHEENRLIQELYEAVSEESYNKLLTELLPIYDETWIDLLKTILNLPMPAYDLKANIALEFLKSEDSKKLLPFLKEKMPIFGPWKTEVQKAVLKVSDGDFEGFDFGEEPE